jgi:hypothetical protein
MEILVIATYLNDSRSHDPPASERRPSWVADNLRREAYERVV